MSESKYIGRSEPLTKKILKKLLDCEMIRPQVPIERVILPEDYAILDQEIKNHKFDFVVYRKHNKAVVVEVNYKHGAKASFKWDEIFVPLIVKSGKLALPINDYECEHLFHQFPDGTHKVTWTDFHDVMNCMQIVGIEPDFSLE